MTLPVHLAGYGANATGRKQINAPHVVLISRATFHQSIDMESVEHRNARNPYQIGITRISERTIS
jgi:hypothetical protein